ncbi:uncharacterized protein LOC133910651 [Phragmites australis]|uniref:uncharacterized protein LOC133910651 n=1 Tax=Phragmites australis TaxID=29695 RepID=UPI002D78CE09|nr:uncharacterized protein LOC133910651 [Phragmites australis]
MEAVDIVPVLEAPKEAVDEVAALETPKEVVEECPSSYPPAPPPPDEYWAGVEIPGQFAPDDDDQIGINEEGQYNKLFDPEPLELVDEADEHDNGNPRFSHFVHDKENPVIKLKATFPNKESFVLALRHNAIREKYEFNTEYSDGDRFRGKCTNKLCEWRIHASRLKPESTFQIKRLPSAHNCGSANKKLEKMANQAWVAERSMDILRKDPTLGAKKLQADLEGKYNIKLDYSMVWKGRSRALAELQGAWENSFQALWSFKAEVESKSPSSVVEIEMERPYLAVDSTHLTGRYTGQLAAVTALDGHTWMFPVAFVIHNDANKGLELAIPKVFNTGVEHRECFKHLLANFKKKFKGAILQNTWPAAWAYTMDKHNEYTELVAKDRPDAIQYLQENHKQLWSRSMFLDLSKVEYVNNNLAESFNSWIRKIKDYPLVELLDTLRTMIMVKLANRYKIAINLQGEILPHVIKELNKKSKGLHYTVEFASQYAAQVSGMTKGNKVWRVVVNLLEATCTCRQWQLSGKPCSHTLAVIFSDPSLNLEDFVSVYYSTNFFRATYSGVLPPMTDKSSWHKVDIGFHMLPPILDRGRIE